MYYSSSRADEIAALCVDFYAKKLPKGAKPKVDLGEWTVYSAIVAETPVKLEVVSAGTGTKCLGKDQISLKGDLVHDSHAEVVARRAFIRFLLEEISNVDSDFAVKVDGNSYRVIQLICSEKCAIAQKNLVYRLKCFWVCLLPKCFY